MLQVTGPSLTPGCLHRACFNSLGNDQDMWLFRAKLIDGFVSHQESLTLNSKSDIPNLRNTPIDFLSTAD